MTREAEVRESLEKWWTETSAEEMERTIPKAVQYGSNSLELTGQMHLLMLPPEQRTRQLALAAACVDYTMGKVARMWAAILRGEMPQPDDYFDVTVYSKMLRHIGEEGEWV